MIILMVTFEMEMAVHQLKKERWIIACFLGWLVSLCVWTFEFSNAIAATTGSIKHFSIWWCSKPPLRRMDDKTTWVCIETSVTTFDWVLYICCKLPLHFVIPKLLEVEEEQAEALGTDIDGEGQMSSLFDSRFDHVTARLLTVDPFVNCSTGL